ncbi:MAG: mechanosensitive ion channel family protein [Pseudomonadota bacterium]|nr:mechanosensitive ion channel family protein [Pseudomonadota bacterium]MDP1906103.1 mechanosensitive ion channel family protein [Pseudomonadota bacterium]MDP2353179.1 mechanosensitive ion channel family protein [Pseudomonadota bacterium]
MNTQLDTLNQVQSTAIDLGLQFGPKVLVACLIILAGHFAGRWLGNLFEGVLTKLDLDITIRVLLVRLARVLVLGLFVVMALQNLGVELLPLVAGLGVAGAGLALAMQGVLSNLAAGLTIIFTRPFRVGEYVSIAGEEGQVESISLFTTILSHYDRSHVVIPNRKIVGEIMHNYGQIRQLHVSVGVAYDTDLNMALADIDAILAANPNVLRDPVPLVQVATLADSSVNISIRPWVSVDAFLTTPSEINKAVLEAFRAKGIHIPFPQREVRLLGQAG